MCVCLLVCNLSSDVPSRVTGSSTNKNCQDRHVPTTEQESWHTHTGRAETMLPVFHVSFRLPPLMGAEIWLTHLETEELREKKKKKVCLRRGETRPSTKVLKRERVQGHILWVTYTQTLFQNLPRVPGVFWKSPSESWEGLGLHSPSKIGLKRVWFLDLPQPGCTESRAGSREVLSKRGPSESLES